MFVDIAIAVGVAVDGGLIEPTGEVTEYTITATDGREREPCTGQHQLASGVFKGGVMVQHVHCISDVGKIVISTVATATATAAVVVRATTAVIVATTTVHFVVVVIVVVAAAAAAAAAGSVAQGAVCVRRVMLAGENSDGLSATHFHRPRRCCGGCGGISRGGGGDGGEGDEGHGGGDKRGAP